MVNMDRIVLRAQTVASAAHVGQNRKYTGEPYLVHPQAVADIIARHNGAAWLQAAALLHDTIEDTELTLEDLVGEFPPEVVDAVDYMTERAWAGNRKIRKTAECCRLAQGSTDCQSLKLADLIDNTSSIVEHDPSFAVVYLREKRALLDALSDAWPTIRVEAERVLAMGEASLLQLRLREMDSRCE